jgi:GNAT superfamily N-acetyltransferase
MHIRYLAVADRDGWQPLWDGYLEFYEQRDFDPAVTEATFSRLCHQEDGFVGHVAIEGERLVGFAHTLTHPSTWTVDRYVYLEDLFVAPDVRRGGIGRALIEAVYERAGERHVYWHTRESNTTGRRLYDTLARFDGFIVYER